MKVFRSRNQSITGSLIDEDEMHFSLRIGIHRRMHALLNLLFF